MRAKLSVNINKVALIRNSRGANYPDLLKFATDCESYGAEGITVHPRPDQRHIKYSDLSILIAEISTELNIEGYPSDRFLNEVIRVKPKQCTLVPDLPGVLTSDQGWNIRKEESLLTDVIQKLKEHGIRCSLFIDPEERQVEAASKINADRIELYTGDYAKAYNIDRHTAVAPHIKCSELAEQSGIQVNAGHDLNLDNLEFYANSIVNLAEVSIGHAIVSDALYYGISNTIGMYRAKLS